MHYNAIMTTTPTKDAAVPASVQHRTSSIGLVSAIAALGGILFGYDTGVMSGALLFIKPDFDMSATQEGVITSILMIGAALGALGALRAASLARLRLGDDRVLRGDRAAPAGHDDHLHRS